MPNSLLNIFLKVYVNVLTTDKCFLAIRLIHTQTMTCGLGTCPRLRRFSATSLLRASRSSSFNINDFFIPTRKHFAKRQQLHERRYLYVIIQLPSCSHTNSRVLKKKIFLILGKFNINIQPTPTRFAFRRKNALHAMHVGTPKLIPIEASSHTRH